MTPGARRVSIWAVILRSCCSSPARLRGVAGAAAGLAATAAGRARRQHGADGRRSRPKRARARAAAPAAPAKGVCYRCAQMRRGISRRLGRRDTVAVARQAFKPPVESGRLRRRARTPHPRCPSLATAGQILMLSPPVRESQRVCQRLLRNRRALTAGGYRPGPLGHPRLFPVRGKQAVNFCRSPGHNRQIRRGAAYRPGAGIRPRRSNAGQADQPARAARPGWRKTPPFRRFSRL